MRLQVQSHTSKTTVTVERVDRGAFSECYVTATADESLPGPRAARELFGSLGEVLRDEKIAVVQEKIYGLLSARVAALKSRKEEYSRRGADPSVPFTYIEGRSPSGAEVSGAQVWGVTGPAGDVRTVSAGRGLTARSWSPPAGGRLLYIPSIEGAAGRKDASPAAHAESMLVRAAAALRSCGLPYSRTFRTWFYLTRLLDWYDGFNRVRNARYAKAGFDANGAPRFPASTGIQGTGGGLCVMDLLALEPGPGDEARPVRDSARQGPAYAYGSAFSRGTVARFAGGRTIHVSGTASIGPDGRSVYGGDAEAQTRQTLASVAAVLGTEGADLDAIRGATVFVKNPAVVAGFHRALRATGAPDFPHICLLADVCRPELLIEIEAVAT